MTIPTPITTQTGMFRGNSVAQQTMADVQGLLTASKLALTAALLAGASAVTAYGLKLDGVTDDTTAFANLALAMGNGGTFYFPPGKGIFSGTITINLAAGKSLQIFGAGAPQSELHWTGTGDGLVINCLTNPTLTSRVVVSGLAITKTSPAVAAGAPTYQGLGMTGTALAITAPGGSGYQQTQPTVSDVWFKVGAHDGNSWLNCLVFTRCTNIIGQNLQWSNFDTYTDRGTFCTVNGVDANFFVVNAFFNTIIVNGCQTGFSVDGFVQSILLDAGNILSCNVCFDWSSADGSAAEALVLTNCYFLAGSRCLRIINNSSSLVANNLFQLKNGLNGATLNATSVAMEIAGTLLTNFTGNQIGGNGTVAHPGFTETAVMWGTVARPNAFNIIDGLNVTNMYGPAFTVLGNNQQCNYDNLNINVSGGFGLGNLPVRPDSPIGSVVVNGVASHGAISTSALAVGASNTGATIVEVGSVTTAGVSAVDFHSSGNNTDFDVRLASTGGNAGAGNGTLTITAGVTSVSGALSVAGQVTADHMEIGGSAGIPAFTDFHSSTNVVDYDVRLQSTGGTTSSGQGTLAILASGLSITLAAIPAAANDAAAATAGVPVGGFYRIANALQIRLV